MLEDYPVMEKKPNGRSVQPPPKGGGTENKKSLGKFSSFSRSKSFVCLFYISVLFFLQIPPTNHLVNLLGDVNLVDITTLRMNLYGNQTHPKAEGSLIKDLDLAASIIAVERRIPRYARKFSRDCCAILQDFVIVMSCNDCVICICCWVV